MSSPKTCFTCDKQNDWPNGLFCSKCRVNTCSSHGHVMTTPPANWVNCGYGYVDTCRCCCMTYRKEDISGTGKCPNCK